ncbi:MAG TPA: hypothetical protein VHL11_21850, partial [Phototrophicaceae bacterium]|nr:hypothetical protein [Phototrophicaceae bacterium]
QIGKILTVFITLSLLLIPDTDPASMTGDSTPIPESRSFYMGFTPFPYEISYQAVDYVYDKLATDADLIVHHFDSGVPWIEALSGEPYGEGLRKDWQYRLDHTPEDHQIYVSVTPINILRVGLAPYYGEKDNLPLPSPWDTYSFDSPEVKTAFLKYCEDIIAFFQPDYFAFGIEVNLLKSNNAALWDAYMTLHRYIYQELKAKYPDLPIFVSMTGIDLLEGYTDVDHESQIEAFQQVMEYSDYLGISIYPYMTRYMTSSLPLAIFDQLAELTDKPLAITETGYPSQSFEVEANGITLNFEGTEEKQQQYIQLLLDAAQKYQFRFVVNFILRDYDALWKMLGSPHDLTIVWRDTGLYDEDGHPRSALTTWQDILKLPVIHPIDPDQ